MINIFIILITIVFCFEIPDIRHILILFTFNKHFCLNLKISIPFKLKKITLEFCIENFFCI